MMIVISTVLADVQKQSPREYPVGIAAFGTTTRRSPTSAPVTVLVCLRGPASIAMAAVSVRVAVPSVTAPEDPAAPVAPVSPLAPADPGAPVAPALPAELVAPVAPVLPAAPVSPFAPVSPLTP